jgi:hypothetical protein
MKRTVLLLGVWLGGLVLSGCASTGMARTLDEGHFQLSVSHSAQLVVGGYDFARTGPSPFPSLELGARYGVTERVDAGARLYWPGAEADVRFGLLRAPSLRRGVDLTLAPSVNYHVLERDRAFWAASLPLLVGLNLDGSQLTFGPRVTYGGGTRTQMGEGSLLFGVSLGYAFPLTPFVRLSTELSMLAEPKYLWSEGAWCRLGIGFIIGGYAQE